MRFSNKITIRHNIQQIIRTHSNIQIGAKDIPITKLKYYQKALIFLVWFLSIQQAIKSIPKQALLLINHRTLLQNINYPLLRAVSSRLTTVSLTNGAIELQSIRKIIKTHLKFPIALLLTHQTMENV